MTSWIDQLTHISLVDKKPTTPFADMSGPDDSVLPGPGEDLGILTGRRSGIFVVDCDSQEATIEFLQNYPFGITHTVKTKRGYHFYFRLPPDITIRNSASKILPKVDVRGEGGYVQATGADRDIYYDVEPIDAPDSLLAWFRGQQQKPATEIQYDPLVMNFTDSDVARRVQKGVLYCKTAEAAVSGNHGHEKTFLVAKYLVSIRLPKEMCLQLLLKHYNPRCQPPWTEVELQHKIDSAAEDPWIDPIAPENFMKRFTEPTEQQTEEEAVAGASKLDAVPFNMLVQILQTTDEWRHVFRYDILACKQIAVNPPMPLAMEHGHGLTNGDIGEIRLWFEQHGGKVLPVEIQNAVDKICQMPGREINPVVEYLDSLPAVDVNAPLELDRIHETVLNSPDGPIASQVVKKQLVAAVKRARAMPGLHEDPKPVDHRVVVILMGPQQAGKTSFIKQLAKEKWYGKLQGDLDDKDVKRNTFGKLLVEMAEMSAGRKDRRTLKAYVSDTSDEVRLPYERNPRKIQRSFVIFGTDNNLQLDDPTGNTRWVPIHVGQKMNEANHLRLVDTFWAEANALALAGYDTKLTDEEKKFGQERAEVHEVDDLLAEALQEKLAGVPFVTMTEAQVIVVGSDEMKKSMVDTKLIGGFSQALIRIGCERVKKNGIRGWLVPSSIATQAKHKNVDMCLKQNEVAMKVRESLASKVMS